MSLPYSYSRPQILLHWLSVCTVHYAIYAITAVVLGSGLSMMDEGIRLFEVVQFGPLLQQPVHHEWFSWLHTWSCIALAGLLALHIGAVIKHQLSGQPVIRQMWL